MPSKNKPLREYLRVQEAWERDLLYVLKRAAAQAERDILALGEKNDVSARVSADRMRLIRKNILAQQAQVWQKIGSTVQARRLEVAAAAVETTFAYEEVLLRSVLPGPAVADLLASSVASAQRTVNLVVARLQGLSERPLSSRVYHSRSLANGQVKRVIESSLVRGLTARELAKEVRGLIDPRTPGGVSFAAQRLGRTELNNAFHAVAVTEMQASPIVEYVEWHLSGSHPRPDECNDLAGDVHEAGQDAGIFSPQDVPGKPHPSCLCFITPVVPERDVFIKNFIAGRYDSYLGT
jgi:hypothetical protein